MKRLKILISCITAAFLLLGCFQFSFAASAELLFNMNGKTVYSDTSLAQIYDMYGKEKLRTKSIFGGNSYSFDGASHNDFLFIETNSKGQIVSYCIFGDTFTSNASNFGDKASYSSSSVVTYTDSNDIIWGVTGYSSNVADKNAALELYNSDAVYGEYIARHAVIMWNAVSKYFGRPANIQFDSRTFYMNRQLMEGGSNFYDYCESVGKSEQFKLISWSSYGIVSNAVPTPGMYGNCARNYTIPSDAFPVFDSTAAGGRIIGSLRSTYFDNWSDVPYTDQERELLSRARKIYNESVEIYNSESDYFEIHPQDAVLPLEPGVIRDSKLYGALGYINAIRAGAGLPLLELSEELSKGCQYKAILTSYIGKNGISNPNPHYPPQPDGVSDEYYAIAQNGAGENLYHGTVITSITNALNDAYGDPITCGHRYNLLNPTWKYIGFGSTEVDNHLSIGIQGVHKMSGYQESDAEIVAWPSKGVMLEEAGAGSNTMYTASFNKTYGFTKDTGVIFKCLNTGETFEFIPGENKQNHELHNSGSIISYYDANISMTVGNVYEITLTNVKNHGTGEIIDYTYRSVYESAYGSDSSDTATDISMSSSSLTMAVNQRVKINASVVPDNCKNKMILWSSDNNEIATVNENGYVTAHKTGTVTISASTDNGVVKYCTVNIQATPFTDLTSKWYIPFVEKAYQCGIMSGMTPTTFEPATSMSRAMFVKVIANLEGLDLDNTVPTVFSDVQVGRYYTGPIGWASQNGIVNGISPTEFAPNSPITREQMCAMIVRYAEYKNIAFDQSISPVTFADEDKISKYAKEYVKICQRAGFIDGMTPTTFEPKGNATRAQVAKIFSIFYNYID